MLEKPLTIVTKLSKWPTSGRKDPHWRHLPEEEAECREEKKISGTGDERGDCSPAQYECIIDGDKVSVYFADAV